MAFDFGEFHSFSLSLLRLANGGGVTGCDLEAAYRSVVSRAYYAAFHYARDYAVELGFGTGASEHERLPKFLHDNLQHTLANRLNQLKRWRVNADYEARPVPRTEAGTCVASARKVMDEASLLRMSLQSRPRR